MNVLDFERLEGENRRSVDVTLFHCGHMPVYWSYWSYTSTAGRKPAEGLYRTDTLKAALWDFFVLWLHFSSCQTIQRPNIYWINKDKGEV